MYQWSFFIILYVEVKAQIQITGKTKQQMDTSNGITTSLPIKYLGEISFRAADDDKNAYCRNRGIMIGHRCICPYPYTGMRCLDFACVTVNDNRELSRADTVAHGISVGIRYDPDSLFFNKPCICDEGWSGDLCDISKANQCNDRGKFINGQCHCMGHFFGSQCQYVSRCDHGKRKHGRCVCDEGWEGDYCQDIVCQHGYPDARNKSNSCVCPARFSGIHCDQCSQKGPKIRPYPECNIDVAKTKARLQRQKVEAQFRSRLRIMAIASILLFILAAMMIFANRRGMYGRRCSEVQNIHRNELEIQKTLL